MVKYGIDIDSHIGGWECSKRWVKQRLKELGTGSNISVRVNSLGGDVDTALDISAQFEAHGDVTCDLYAFNASAATVLTLGAAKVRMHENSMYLIHKAMVWVSEWGAMNEDDIDSVIERLKSMKDNAAVMTLNLAKMYAKKSNKSIQDILNLMREEKWLDAHTAKEWGFVDEVFSGSIPVKEKSNIVDMLNFAGLPAPSTLNVKEFINTEELKNDKPVNTETDISRRDLLEGFISNVKKLFNNNTAKPSSENKNMEKNKKIIVANLVMAILKVDNIEVIDGDINLTEGQLLSLENAILDKDNEISRLKAIEKSLGEEITNLKNDIEAKNEAPGDVTNDVSHETDIVGDEDGNEDIYVDNSHFSSAKKMHDILKNL